MKGLKIIPLFLGLIVLSYLGMLFVEANRDEVVITFWGKTSSPTAQGLVVLTSALVGMLICGALCSVELLVLYAQNRKLRRRLAQLGPNPYLKPNPKPDASRDLLPESPAEVQRPTHP